MSGFILGLLYRKSVKFAEIAAVLNAAVKDESNLRRIQSFFADHEMDYLAIAGLLMSFVPLRRLAISIDRTNWQVNGENINIFCLTVHYQGVGIPILFDMLDKKGNTDQQERIDLLDKFCLLFGEGRIGSLMGDREFIGEKWYKYLINKKIPFYLRLPKSHRVTVGGIHYRIDKLIDAIAGTKEVWLNRIFVNGIELNIGLKKLHAGGAGRKEDDYLAILTNDKGYKALKEYKKRWSIETFFQSIKKRGFDIEQTHLDEPSKIQKLFALVAIAFACCITIGIHHNKTVKTIPTKNHGYKQNSFFRVGLDKFFKAIKDIKDSQFELNRILSIIYDLISKNISAWNLDKKIIT